jgi:hypothetical protein
LNRGDLGVEENIEENSREPLVHWLALASFLSTFTRKSKENSRESSIRRLALASLMRESIKAQENEWIHFLGLLCFHALFSFYRAKKKDTNGISVFLHLSLWGGINVICLKSFFEQVNNNIPPT